MQRMFLFMGVLISLAAIILYFAANHATKTQYNSLDTVDGENQFGVNHEILERLPYQLQSDISIKDKAIVVNLWATWCGPCRKEIPELNKIVTSANPEHVLFLAYSDEDEQDYIHMIEENPRLNFDYTLVFDHLPLGDYLKSLDSKNKGKSIPVHLLISPNGSVENILIGNKASYLRQIESFVQKYN